MMSSRTLCASPARDPVIRNGRTYVPPELAVWLLESDTVLSSVSRNLFRSLQVTDLGIGSGTSLTVAGSLEHQRRRFPQLISALRETLTELKIVKSSSYPWLTQSIMCKYPQLKRLFFSCGENCPLTHIFSSQGGNLEVLAISKRLLHEEDVSALAEFAKGLKTFSLSAYHVSTQMDNLWESIGETLEELSIHQVGDGVDVSMPSIAQNSKKLRKLTVTNFEFARHEELEALCISLGGQLECLTLTHCGIDHMRLARICAACRNASLELREAGGCTAIALCAIGEKSSVLSIGPDTVQDSENLLGYLRYAGEQSKNLIAIWTYDGIPETPFRAFFHHPKKFLVKFVGLFYDLRDVRYIFEALMNSVSSLKEFDFIGRLPPKIILREFVQGNPLLKTVRFVDIEGNCNCKRLQRPSLNGDGGDRNPSMDLKTAAKVFLESKKLENLSITCRAMYRCEGREDVKRNEEFSKVCASAQFRNISVEMCGYRYS